MTRSERGGLATVLTLIVLGLVVGVFSGLFGIGGGLLIVPGLVFFLGMDHRMAAGTSVAAILPTAAAGAVSYAVQGNVEWIAAACLAAGIIVGANIGSRLLTKLPIVAIQWVFLVFLLVVIVALWLVVPQRDDVVEVTWFAGVMLAVTGVLTGIIGGIVGLGGGIIVVPIMMFFFGANDLVAKGTSLMMMVPGSISGTIANVKRGNVNVRAAVIIGVAAAASVPFGSVFAGLLDPLVANVLFSIFLMVVFTQMLLRRLRAR